MRGKEAQVQTKFGRWLQYVYLPAHEQCAVAFELKYSEGPAIPFSGVLPHQKQALLNAKARGLYYKIPDEGMSQKPFDCFVMRGVESFVVLVFKDRFYLIDIDVWSAEEGAPGRRSVTEARAAAMADSQGQFPRMGLRTPRPSSRPYSDTHRP